MTGNKECVTATKLQQTTAALILAALLSGGGLSFAQASSTLQSSRQTAPATQQNLPSAPGASDSSSRGNPPSALDVSRQDSTPSISPAQAPAQAGDARIQGTKVDPAAGPQTPASVSAEQQAANTQVQATNARRPAEQQPLGTAAAERGRTHGGVASRPAGVAIAPAKQHQMRSILIKTGALLAGAAAIGTVYGLTKATPSNPPGATKTTVSASTTTSTAPH